MQGDRCLLFKPFLCAWLHCFSNIDKAKAVPFLVFSYISESILMHIQFIFLPLGKLLYKDLPFLRDFKEESIGLWLYQIVHNFSNTLDENCLMFVHIH